VLDATGGNVDGTADGATVDVDVPAGAFSAATEVTIFAGTPSSVQAPDSSGSTASLLVAVGLLRDGVKLTGTIPVPVVVTVEDASISSSDELVVYDSANGEYLPAADATFLSGVTFSAGKVSFDLDADPAVAVEAPASTSSSEPAAIGPHGVLAGTPGATGASTPSSPASQVAATTGAGTASTPSSAPATPATDPASPARSGSPSAASPSPSAASPSASVASPAATGGSTGVLAFTGTTPLLIWLLAAGAVLALAGTAGRRTARARAR
jgi:hypothetical protein